MDNYNYTGANIPIDINIVISYTIKQLKEYDDKLSQGILLSKSPYNDKIIMKMENDKIIEVPYEVQQEAIKKWEIIKAESEYEMEKKSLEERIESISNQLNDELTENFEDAETSTYSFIIKFIAIILIVGIALYFFYKQKIYV